MANKQLAPQTNKQLAPQRLLDFLRLTQQALENDEVTALHIQWEVDEEVFFKINLKEQK